MQCIAVDDEPLALQIIEDYCDKIDFLELVGTYSSASSAGTVINQGNIDLVFLDIQMPNISGIEFIKTMVSPPIIILTTAYNQYALEGYDLSVTDYLLKPFSFERFFKSANKAFEHYQLKQNASNNINGHNLQDFILIKSDYQTIKVNYNDILYVESMADYVRIITTGKKHTALATMKSIEETLPAPQFLRIHRSYIISISKIDAFNKKMVHIGETDIPIGDSYRDTFEKLMQNRTIGK